MNHTMSKSRKYYLTLKSYLYFPIYFLLILEDYITGLDSNIAMNIDKMIDEFGINPQISRFFKTKQLQFMFLIVCNFLIINFNFSAEYPKIIFLFLYYSNLLITFILIVLIFKTNPGINSTNEEFEKVMKSKQPLIAHNVCPECNLLKCLRAFHCPFCKKCILRFEFHSKWFNKCIGSQNTFIYIIFLITISFHFTLIVFYLILEIFILSNFKFFSFLLLFVLMIFITLKLWKFTFQILKNASRNLTYYEKTIWSRLPYLWSNMSRFFFNPFDKKSVLKNFKELYNSYVNPSINPNLVEKHNRKSVNDEARSLKNNNDLEIKEKNNEDVYFISSDNLVYYDKFYGLHENAINWSKYRIYSVLDVVNSPMCEIIIEQLKNQPNNK